MVRPHFELYRGKNGWRWRLLAANHKVLADSGEGYKEQRRAREGIDRCIEILMDMARRHAKPVIDLVQL